MSGIAPNILTDRLRRLERAGVIVGQRYSQRPVRLAYELTQEGQELAGVLAQSGGSAASDTLSSRRWHSISFRYQR